MHYSTLVSQTAPVVLVMGLPGSGKTELSKILTSELGGVHINADYIRKTVSKDLGFSPEDRIKQAQRMGAIARMICESGVHAIVDFVCPTKETRHAFQTYLGRAQLHIIWMDTIAKSRFEDTNQLFVEPNPDEFVGRFRALTGFIADKKLFTKNVVNIAAEIKDHAHFSTRDATALVIGRFQGAFHEGHLGLVRAGLEKSEQVLIFVRDSYKTSDKDPLPYSVVRAEIERAIYEKFPESLHRISIQQAPNFSHVLYGRDVGYKIEQISLGAEVEAISASKLRGALDE